MKYFVVLVVLASFLFGCDYKSNPVSNNSEPSELSGGQKGNTAEVAGDVYVVSYEADIKPLFREKCNEQCHGAASAKNWQSYAIVREKIDEIIASINHEPGVMSMPFGGKLPNKELKLIENWARDGMVEKAPVQAGPIKSVPQEIEPEATPGPQETQGDTAPEKSMAESIGEVAIEPCIGASDEEAAVSVVTDVAGEVDVEIVVKSKGEELYEANCANCHDNIGIGIVPRLAGQNKKYLMDQIKEFKTGGSRVDATMNYYADTYFKDEAMIEEVAEYLSQLDPCSIPHQILAVKENEVALEADIAKGKVAAAACLGCHTNNKSNGETPVLFGQNPSYLLKTITELKSKARPSNTMQWMLGTVDRQQIIDIAAYLNQKNECE